MRDKLAIFMIFSLIIQVQPVCAAATPQETTIDIQSDGVASIAYLFPAEATSLQTNITLLGDNIENLFIVNENGLPLEYVEGDEIAIYSLGSSLVNLTYLTPDLTSKAGIIWSLELDSPISTEILLPTGATIINLNNIPLEIDTVDDRTQIIMPAGHIEVSYTVNILDSETLAEDAINEAEEAIQELGKRGVKIIAINILSSGAISIEEACRYLENFKNEIYAVAYGTTKPHRARGNATTLKQYLSSQAAII